MKIKTLIRLLRQAKNKHKLEDVYIDCYECLSCVYPGDFKRQCVIDVNENETFWREQ